MHWIRAITLDLDDTLWEIEPVIVRAEYKIYEQIRERFPRVVQRYDINDIRSIRQRVVETHPEISHDLTEMRRIAFEWVLRECDYDPENSHILLEQFLKLRHQVEFFSDVLPALQRLSERYPLLTVTNGNADIERLGITHFFTGQVTARAAGISKPDPRIFEIASEALGEIPEAVLHVGDHPMDDVLGALNAGFQAVWINRRFEAWAHERRPNAEVTTLIELADLLENKCLSSVSCQKNGETKTASGDQQRGDGVTVSMKVSNRCSGWSRK